MGLVRDRSSNKRDGRTKSKFPFNETIRGSWSRTSPVPDVGDWKGEVAQGGLNGGHALAARGRGGYPRGVVYHHLRRETKGRWRMNACRVKSNKGTLMAPSRRGQITFKVGGWVVLNIVILVIILCRAWELYVEEDRVLAMAERILPIMEGRRDGCNCGRNLEVGGLEERVLKVTLCI